MPSFSLRLLCLAAVLALVLPSCMSTTPQAQIYALNDLYYSTNGYSWTNNANWGVGDPCDSQWYGVFCDRYNVTDLRLSKNGLSGTIPYSIGNLVALNNVDLTLNHLSSSIPASLWTPSLEFVSLDYNMLSGTIPSFSGLNLVALSLSHNQFSGSLPDFPPPKSYVSLFLDLSHNMFTGTIPQAFYNYSLSYLDISSNQISGTVSPGSFSGGRMNDYLNISNNHLSGDTSFIQNSQGLMHLDISNNAFTGPIYTSKETDTLIYSGNKLSGTIPESMFTSTYIYTLDLSNNQLTGTIPASLQMSNSLAYLNISRNQLNGTILFSNNKGYFRSIDYSFNKFTGTIPSIGSSSNLLHLKLDHNKLSGTIPDSISNLSSLIDLTLQDNMLNGTLPKILQSNPGYEVFNASNNAFTCPLPTWCSAPPSGNGECSPCANSTPTTNFYCCAYSSNGCKSIAQVVCEINTCSPSLGSGLYLCGLFPTTSCGYCFSGSSLLLDQLQPINSLSSTSSRGSSKSVIIN